MNDQGISLRNDSRSRISTGHREISPPKNLADMRAKMKSKKLAETNASKEGEVTTQDNINNLNRKIDEFAVEFKKHR